MISVNTNCTVFLNNDKKHHFIVTRFLYTDVEPPVISHTPSNQNVNTDDRSATATVSWTPPTASDNSGYEVSLTSNYSPGYNFAIGTTAVTYTAVDVYGNLAVYSFNVAVIGKVN